MDDVDRLLVDLARWAGDARAEEAAASRRREHWLRQQAGEEARLAGVALDLAERGTGVAVGTTAGRVLSGRVLAVARDFWVMGHDGGGVTFVALAAVATVRPQPGHRRGQVASGRPAPLDARLGDVLVGVAGDRPRVRLVLAGGAEPLAGDLWAVGVDVVTLRLDADPPTTVYVHLASVQEVRL